MKTHKEKLIELRSRRETEVEMIRAIQLKVANLLSEVFFALRAHRAIEGEWLIVDEDLKEGTRVIRHKNGNYKLKYFDDRKLFNQVTFFGSRYSRDSFVTWEDPIEIDRRPVAAKSFNMINESDLPIDKTILHKQTNVEEITDRKLDKITWGLSNTLSVGWKAGSTGGVEVVNSTTISIGSEHEWENTSKKRDGEELEYKTNIYLPAKSRYIIDLYFDRVKKRQEYHISAVIDFGMELDLQDWLAVHESKYLTERGSDRPHKIKCNDLAEFLSIFIGRHPDYPKMGTFLDDNPKAADAIYEIMNPENRMVDACGMIDYDHSRDLRAIIKKV